jgi:hypothetical protein
MEHELGLEGGKQQVDKKVMQQQMFWEIYKVANESGPTLRITTGIVCAIELALLSCVL